MLTLGHWNESVERMAFSPDGRLLACGNKFGRVAIWYLDDWRPKPAWHWVGYGDTLALSFTPDGRHLIHSGGAAGLTVIDSPGQSPSARTPLNNYTQGHLALGDERLIVAMAGSTPWSLLSVDLPAVKWEERHWGINDGRQTVYSGLASLPNSGRFIAVETRREQHTVAETDWLTIRNTGTGGSIAAAPLGGMTTCPPAVSPDGSAVVVPRRTVLYVFLVPTMTKLVEVKTHARRHYTGVAFHPSGRYLAATSNDGTLKVYDTKTWTVAKTYTWNVGRLRSVAFSPDGLLAAAGSETGRVIVWDVDL